MQPVKIPCYNPISANITPHFFWFTSFFIIFFYIFPFIERPSDVVRHQALQVPSFYLCFISCKGPQMLVVHGNDHRCLHTWT